MQSFQVEGVILHTLDFRDYDQILTLFTREEGIIKAVVNGANRPKRRGGFETAPMIQAEFLLSRGREELMKCKEISILQRHLGCRNSLETIETACELLQILLQTQMPGKAAPSLYALFTQYLAKIPLVPEPWRLSASFCLKLLRHEGYLAETLHCSQCDQPIKQLYLSHGEYFCNHHAPANSFVLNSEETEGFYRGAYGRTLSEVLSGHLNKDFSDLVRAICKKSFDFA